MAERKRSENPMHFEKSLEQLEQIVKRLEEDAVPLDQALKLFSEGQTLARACEGQLRAAENQIRKLMETPQGEIIESELESSETREASPGADPEGDDADDAPPSAPPRRTEDLPF